MIKELLIGVAAFEAFVRLAEIGERQQAFTQARSYADSVDKPLLVVGTPRLGWVYHPCGDVTIDIDPVRTKYCDTQIADVRNIPYSHQYFGAAFVSHVLEHLPMVADAYAALEELHRVAEKVFIVSPHKICLYAWIVPSHHLWVTADGDDFIIEQRRKKPAKITSCLVAITASS